jgi:hypothetical protein
MPHEELLNSERIRLEKVLDAIADALIEANFMTPQYVRDNQKTIRNNQIAVGRESVTDLLILYEKDIAANHEDLFGKNTNDESLIDIIKTLTDDQWSISVTGNIDAPIIQLIDSKGTTDSGDDVVHIITNILTSGDNNPINISQFMNVNQVQTTVNKEDANEFLDTTIFELLPGAQTRQERIDNFFIEWEELKGIIPDYDLDGQPNGSEVASDFNPSEHHNENDITYDNPDGNIVRLTSDGTDTVNSGQTLQELRDELNDYLKDIDESLTVLSDETTPYSNQSDGYLKFRNPNQGIIVRNTDTKFVESLNPTDLSANNNFLSTGFTITMWVRFLDKTSTGTLFNFGNPIRNDNPLGFKLETIIGTTNDINERYVRLLVFDSQGIGAGSTAATSRYYDSHTGIFNMDKIDTTNLNSLDTINVQQYTKIPTNFSEWYFICATYNPLVNEINSFTNTSYLQDINYWLNNVDADGSFLANSNLGNRAKIEFISKTDLLRARGYKA